MRKTNKCRVYKLKKEIKRNGETYEAGSVLTEYFYWTGVFYSKKSIESESGINVDEMYKWECGGDGQPEFDDYFEGQMSVEYKDTEAFHRVAQKILKLRNEAEALNAEADRIEKLL